MDDSFDCINCYVAYMMMFCSMELHYIIFLYCILSMRCELYDRDSFVLFYPDYRPWLPGTPFSALFP